MSIKILKPEKDFVTLPFVDGSQGVAKAIIWPGMGAKFGSMHYFVMPPGEKNVPHSHETMEDMFYVVQGKGYIIDGDNKKHYFTKGDFVYVPPKCIHAVVSEGPEDFISVGGPTPPDAEMYKKAGLKW